MKTQKVIAQMAEHKPTGAKIPMIVKSVDKNNVITDYKEFIEHRKGFTLSMLQTRWDLCKDSVIELLQKYQIPAHVNHQDVKNLPKGASPIDVAIFFEEYIFGVEKKEKLKHTKLKPKRINSMRVQ